MLYQKILLKLSGEAFSGDKGHGIDRATLAFFASEIKSVLSKGVKVAIVIGGGNFWRGRTAQEFDRVTADSIGMMATVMNALAFKDVVLSEGMPARVFSAVEIPKFTENLVISKAKQCFNEGYVTIFAGGTGSPFFSTDSAAALRSLDIGAQAILKATLVDGVYDKDPNEFKDAVKYDYISYIELLEKGLKVIDSTAASLCMDNKMPIHVFNLKQGNLLKLLSGESLGTIIKETK